MPQLYFLSILCNGLAGYVLFKDSEGDAGEIAQFSIKGPTFNLILGIMCAVTGVLKLLSPFEGDLLVIGDLLPAAAGLIAGLMLIFGIYRQDLSAKAGELDRLGVSLLVFRKPIGLALMAIGLLHFLFPKALFL
ncbi:MAG: hypothetical protein FWD28_00480 [Treponema sp.]|nr:hypothetical protein [Treponema sp.]